jgi:hypothetical protein
MTWRCPAADLQTFKSLSSSGTGCFLVFQKAACPHIGDNESHAGKRAVLTYKSISIRLV